VAASATTADSKSEKSTQQKSKTTSKTADSKSSNTALTGSDDVCIVDSDSESEDFSCKKSKKSLNNNNNNSDAKVSKRSKVKRSNIKESNCSGTSSHRQHEDKEQQVSECTNKAADSTHKKSKGKKVKDEASALNHPSTKTSKSNIAHQQVLLILYHF